MCNEFDSECVLQVCNLCENFVDSLDVIVVNGEILCCDCYFEYIEKIDCLDDVESEI